MADQEDQIRFLKNKIQELNIIVKRKEDTGEPVAPEIREKIEDLNKVAQQIHSGKLLNE